MFENKIDFNFQLLNTLLTLFIKKNNKAQLAGRRAQNSESNLQECKWSTCPGGRSHPIGFISKTTGIYGIEFTDRL